MARLYSETDKSFFVTYNAKMSVVFSLEITDIYFWHSCCNKRLRPFVGL